MARFPLSEERFIARKKARGDGAAVLTSATRRTRLTCFGPLALRERTGSLQTRERIKSQARQLVSAKFKRECRRAAMNNRCAA
jgi:hypothetical protein